MHLKEPSLYRRNRQVQDPAFYLSSSIFKAPIYVFIISFMVGFSRLLFLGFHPILQGAILGLLCGTITAKLLLIEQTKKEKLYVFVIWACVIFVASVLGQYWGFKFALPLRDFEMISKSFLVNDFREPILWSPFAKPFGYQLVTGKVAWSVAQVLDLIALAIAGTWSLKIAKKMKPQAGKLPTEWPIYRMLIIFTGFIFALFYTSKPLVSANRQSLISWKQELWSDQIMKSVYQHQNLLVGDSKAAEAIRVEDEILKACDASYPFPEGHLWLALKQIQKENRFLIRDELDRAVWETEHLNRRILLPNGRKTDMRQFLAHLYQLRSKFRMDQEEYLKAERDLTVAIILHKECWMEDRDLSPNGFYEHEADVVEAFGLSPAFGFGASYYERYQVRLNLGDQEQAEYDLQEAKSLGYKIQ